MSTALNNLSIAHAAPGLTTSFAYRQRIAITVMCVLAGLSGTLLTTPDVFEGTPLDHLFDSLGWGTLLLAIVIRLWSSTHISGRKSKKLVTTGPYALCRNPQYVGTLLIATSQILFLKSWPFALASVLPIVLYNVGVVPAEERLLSHRFGTEYLDYCRTVPRWSPRWNVANLRWSQPQSWPAFREECSRCVWWLLLPFASEFISAVREMISSIG